MLNRAGRSGLSPYLAGSHRLMVPVEELSWHIHAVRDTHHPATSMSSFSQMSERNLGGVKNQEFSRDSMAGLVPTGIVCREMRSNGLGFARCRATAHPPALS